MANQYDTNLKLQAIADAIGDSQSSGLISALEDIADAVAGGGGGSSAGLVSDEFSETRTYIVGDYCIHNNTLYKCIRDISTAGPWDQSDWVSTNTGVELSSLNSALHKHETGTTFADLISKVTALTDAEYYSSNIVFWSSSIGYNVIPTRGDVRKYELTLSGSASYVLRNFSFINGTASFSYTQKNNDTTISNVSVSVDSWDLYYRGQTS